MRNLTDRESRRRDDLCAIAQKRLNAEAESRAEAGDALGQLKGLLECSKPEWDQFCRQFFKVLDLGGEWQPLSGRHADRLIVFGEQRSRLGPIGPRNESQARALGQAPPRLQGSVMDAVVAEGPPTGSRISELVRKAMGSKNPEEVIEQSKAAALRKNHDRKQESEGEKDRKKVCSIQRKLEKLRVGVVRDVGVIIAAARKTVGLLDVDRLEPVLVEMMRHAREIEDLAGRGLAVIGDEGAVEMARAA